MNRAGTSASKTPALELLHGRRVGSWDELHVALDEVSRAKKSTLLDPSETGGAVGFVTFEYGIDGVSMEIAKYAASLEDHFGRHGQEPVVHCIGGDFTESVDHVLAARWRRHVIPGANGWRKWQGGKWYDAMFHQDMPEGSSRSGEIAAEVWRQAAEQAQQLIRYLVGENIDLMIPVNVNSNPGNPAFALAVVLASELTGVLVVNSNHDFYWESGKPAAARKKGEEPGARDHFFRNHENRSFFRLIERIFPWNGDRWIQLVINSHQARTLASQHGFDQARVIELGTFVEDSYFTPCARGRRQELRLRLGRFLGNEKRTIGVRSVDDFLAHLSEWMNDQQPVVCGSEAGLSFETSERRAIWLLQPTRVVTRKRIERDWELIGTLFRYPPFRVMFEDNADLTLTLHVTGPVPVEHREDLLRLLTAYREVVNSLPPFVGRRVFQAFTAGKLGHSEFQRRDPANMTVSDLYQLSDLVFLPSQTEGRGLPILESAAAGVPLVCSRYEPREVFANVVGEALKPELQIRYTHFPDGGFDSGLLQEITDILFLPEYSGPRKLHNRRAVAARFSRRSLTSTFESALKRLAQTPE